MKNSIQKCRICGCDDNHACKGGCYWIEPNLCSSCAEKINSYQITILTATYIGDNKISITLNETIIADEIETSDKAQGFIYGYIEAKNRYDDSDTSKLQFVLDPEIGKYYTILISRNIENEEYYFFEEV